MGAASMDYRLLRQCYFLCAVSVCWLALATESGSEERELSWAAGKPSAAASDVMTADQRQSLLDSVFRMHVPALLTPVASQSLSRQAELSTLRSAIRPDGVDGWRAASSIDPQPAGQPATADNEAIEPSIAQRSSDLALPLIEMKFRPARLGPPVAVPRVGAEPSNSATPSVVDAMTDNAPIHVEAPSAPEKPGHDWPNSTTPADSAVITPVVDKPLPPLTRQLSNLRPRVRSVLKGYYRKTLNSRDHDPWETMHGMLAYGVQSRIRQGGPRGNMVTAVGWLCYNKPCKGQTLMHVTRDGELRAKYGVGLQGHLGQLLAMLAQCRVSADYPIHVGKQEFTIRDLIEAEKTTCYPKSELTFKLIALQYYLDLDDKWVNDQGAEWNFPRLLSEELAQPIRGAACGGTHRLSGLSLTVKRRLTRGEPLDGEYARADEFVKKYHQYAFRLQNRDGSLSTSWFQGRGDESDIDRRIKTTGHILEWLCYSLSDEELRDPRTVRAVSYLANLMYSNYDHEWEVGPVSHATHALLLYDERVFQPYDSAGYAVSYRPKRSAANRTPENSTRR
jgi:hypothetical protein